MDMGRDYVQITATEANIHTQPAEWSMVVVQAQKGDIFRSYGTEGQWYEISLVSVEKAYLHQSLAVKAEMPMLEVSLEIRKNICVELEQVKNNALQEERQARDEWRKFLKLQERVINLKDSRTYTFHYLDRYQLPIFRKYEISPALVDEMNCGEILHKPSTHEPDMRIDMAIAVLVGIAQYVVLGVLISAPLVVHRRIKSKASKPSLDRQVLWSTLVFGTLMSIVLVAVGVAVVTEDLLFILWYGGVLWWLQVLLGILGFSVVGSYYLALRLARKRISQKRRTENEHSKNGKT